MSPEIRINGQLVADVPDETGPYHMLDGSPLYVDVSGIEARQNRQILVVESPAVGGRRVIGLTQEGKGATDKLRKGGDGKQPILAVTLCERPIRISYWDKVYVERARTLGGPNEGGYYQEVKRTYHNPRWMRR
ncbi:hypothetical protein HY386_00565 [Candidatus Daviesbacteria bacterium]|nr:hypothetical protein [Candidatus Daviesbacteria bacterium]